MKALVDKGLAALPASIETKITQSRAIQGENKLFAFLDGADFLVALLVVSLWFVQ
jgi:hypothetical protein